MSRPIVLQQPQKQQREFLETIVRRSWPGKTYQLSTFEELQELTRKQNVRMVFFELTPDSEAQVQWVRQQDDRVIGVVNWKWTQPRLTPFVDAGLSDYIVKPYQPDRISDMIRHRRELFETRG